MRASIIIVAYNNRAEIVACLASVLADCSPDDEVIVVDNASVDGTADVVRSRFPGVRLLCGPNTGYAGGNNRGAAAAQGEFLVFLNPDTMIAQGCISALVEPLRDQRIGMTTGCIVLMDRPTLINACGNTVHLTGLTYCRGAGQARQAFQRPLDVDAVSGAACAIRRELFTQLGGFDPEFFLYVEDTDLSLRVRLQGLRCRYIPEALIAHAYRFRMSPDKLFYLERNRLMMLLKNLRWASLLRLLPSLLLGELVMWGFVLLRGPRFAWAKLRAYAWLGRNTQRLRRTYQRRHPTVMEIRLLAELSDHLEFGQAASPWVAYVAEVLFDPPFRLARVLVTGGHR